MTKTIKYKTYNMSSPKDTYCLVSNILTLDPSAPIVDLDSHSWVPAVAINDTDLMFEGKSLRWWFEDEQSRRGSSNGSQEEERQRPSTKALDCL
jgi:hypothetical protein